MKLNWERNEEAQTAWVPGYRILVTRMGLLESSPKLFRVSFFQADSPLEELSVPLYTLMRIEERDLDFFVGAWLSLMKRKEK